MFEEVHSLVNRSQTPLVPVAGDSWWVLLWGSAGTWVLGWGWGLIQFPAGISPPSVQMVILSSPDSLLQSPGEVLKTQIPWPHGRPREYKPRRASSALGTESRVHSQEAGRAWATGLKQTQRKIGSDMCH